MMIDQEDSRRAQEDSRTAQADSRRAKQESRTAQADTCLMELLLLRVMQRIYDFRAWFYVIFGATSQVPNQTIFQNDRTGTS